MAERLPRIITDIPPLKPGMVRVHKEISRAGWETAWVDLDPSDKAQAALIRLYRSKAEKGTSNVLRIEIYGQKPAGKSEPPADTTKAPEKSEPIAKGGRGSRNKGSSETEPPADEFPQEFDADGNPLAPVE